MNSNTQATDHVDPQTVPTFALSSGAAIPAIGLGTFGSDHVSAEEVADAVRNAAKMGYRHFDCAAVYSNEKEIGAAISDVVSDGVPREDLWITSKLWNDKHAKQDVIPACKKSLSDLGLDYVDLYLVHWPFPNYHPPGCDVSSRSADAKPYIHENYMETWGEIEKLQQQGLVRHVGTSNMTIPKLELLLRDASTKPVANEMELHPHFQQPELFDYVVGQGIVPIGFSPLGSPGRPERDRTPEDTVDMEDPIIVEIAQRREVHPAAICLKWAVQRGNVVIPFSTNPRNYLSNLKAVAGPPLADSEMQAISGIDKNSRLIKGQVFLWKDDQTWEDLWDLDGTIAQ